MGRILSIILVATAMLVQIRTGALPSDQMCLNFGDARPACSCCGKKAHSEATKPCCRTEGCERCVRVPAPERQIAPQTKARTLKAAETTVAAAVPAMVWRLKAPSVLDRVAVRADESPPDLVRLRTTRLLL
jgi:hypothetical protein